MEAQILDMNNSLDFTLSDGTHVTVHKKSSSSDESVYYYLPTHLRFSTTKDNEPEFSFLEYKNSDGSSRAIMHFLITWGLTKNQIQEAQDSLRLAKGSDAKLMGAVMPEAMDPEKGFTITGKSPLVNILNRSITAIGRPTVLSNAKTAASFHFKTEDLLTIKSVIEENSSDLKHVMLTLSYYLVLRQNRTGKTIKTEFILKNNFFNLLNQKS